MRLIDADRLMDSLRGNVLIDVTPKLEQAIEEQPTVFDKEKVIQQVQLFRSKFECTNCTNNKAKRIAVSCDECMDNFVKLVCVIIRNGLTE